MGESKSELRREYREPEPVAESVAGLKALVGSIVATSAVRWAAVAILDIPIEFPPLAGPGPTIFFTAVGALGAIAVFAVLRRRSDRPEYLFRWIALGVLLLSTLPDLALLGDGAAGAFPGATPTGVTVLMVMHVVAAAVIVWGLTVRLGDSSGQLTHLSDV